MIRAEIIKLVRSRAFVAGLASAIALPMLVQLETLVSARSLASLAFGVGTIGSAQSGFERDAALAADALSPGASAFVVLGNLSSGVGALAGLLAGVAAASLEVKYDSILFLAPRIGRPSRLVQSMLLVQTGAICVAIVLSVAFGVLGSRGLALALPTEAASPHADMLNLPSIMPLVLGAVLVPISFAALGAGLTLIAYGTTAALVFALGFLAADIAASFASESYGSISLTHQVWCLSSGFDRAFRMAATPQLWPTVAPSAGCLAGGVVGPTALLLLGVIAMIRGSHRLGYRASSRH